MAVDIDQVNSTASSGQAIVSQISASVVTQIMKNQEQQAGAIVRMIQDSNQFANASLDPNVGKVVNVQA